MKHVSFFLLFTVSSVAEHLQEQNVLNSALCLFQVTLLEQFGFLHFGQDVILCVKQYNLMLTGIFS